MTASTHARVVVLDRCHPLLQGQLKAGGRILVIGRFSTGAGKAAYQNAAKSGRTAAAIQARAGVVDIRPVLPGPERLAAALARSRDINHARDKQDRPFTNRYYTQDLEDNVTVHLSAGSGRKVDADTLHVPAVLRLSQETLRVHPVLIMAANMDRYARNTWALGPWIDAILEVAEDRGSPVFLSSGDEPASPFDDLHESRLFAQIQYATHGAQQLREHFERAFADMEDIVYPGHGWIEWPHHQAPPAGWDTAWISDPHRPGRGIHVAFPDTPDCRPPEDRIIYGASQVMRPDEHGTPQVVDQIALVREAVNHRFDDGWSARRSVQLAYDRGYSTRGLRQLRGNLAAEFADPVPESTAEDRDRTRDGWYAITKNARFYQTGELEVRVPGRPDPVRYHNMMPAAGYGSPEAMARWAVATKEDQRKHQQARRYLLGHLGGTWNGVPVYLSGFCDPDGRVHYFARVQTGHHHPPGLPRPEFPAKTMELSWLEGLVTGQTALTWLTGPPPEPTATEHQAAVMAAQHAVAEAEQQKKAAWATVAYLIQHGAPDDESVVQARADHNQAAGALAQAQQKLTVAEQQQAERVLPGTPAGLAVDDVLKHLDRLADPLDVTDSPLWKTAVTDLDFTTGEEIRHGFTVWVTQWTGTLRLVRGGECREISFHGSSARLARRHEGEKMVRLVSGLRRGVPLRDAKGKALLLTRIRAVLGLPPGSPFPLGTVQDPRILRDGMAVCHPPPAVPATVDGIEGLPLLGGPPLTRRQLRGAANRLGEHYALIRRIHDLDTPPGTGQRRWVTTGDAAAAIAFWYAADHDGQLPRDAFTADQWHALCRVTDHGEHHREWCATPDGRELAPCPACQGRLRIPLRIREATEPVCLDCELDTTGVPWPLIDYWPWLLIDYRPWLLVAA